MISTGVVSQTSPLQVTLDGATAATPAKAIYSPSVGDRVVVLQYGRLLLVLPTSPISGGGGSSGVSSFNTRTGAVTLAKSDVTGTGLAAADVGADASGAAAAAQAASLQKSSNLADLASASTARSNLGLGSAATQPSSAFDAAGAAAAAAAGVLPSPSGQAGKVLTVNAGGTGYELDTPASGGGGGALSALAGSISSNVSLPGGSSSTTIFTTGSLAPGTWLVTMSAQLSYFLAKVVFAAQVASGTATLAGVTSCSAFPSAGGSYALANPITFLATVTAAATLSLIGQCSSSAIVAYESVSTGAFPGSTGWTAVKIA